MRRDISGIVYAILIGICISAIGLFLSGCAPWFAPNSAAVNAVIDTGIEETADDIAAANDRLGRVLSRASCALSLGAFSRMQPTQQWGFLALCTGQTPQLTPMTVVPIQAAPAPDASLPSPSSEALPPDTSP